MPKIIKDEMKFMELMDIVYEQYHKVRNDRDELRKNNVKLNMDIVKLKAIINILRNKNIDN
jgi:hypothetical protein